MRLTFCFFNFKFVNWLYYVNCALWNILSLLIFLALSYIWNIYTTTNNRYNYLISRFKFRTCCIGSAILSIFFVFKVIMPNLIKYFLPHDDSVFKFCNFDNSGLSFVYNMKVVGIENRLKCFMILWESRNQKC